MVRGVICLTFINFAVYYPNLIQEGYDAKGVPSHPSLIHCHFTNEPLENRMKQLKQFSVVASGLIAFAASAMASPPESAEALMSGGTPPAPQKVTAQAVQPTYTKALKGEKLSSEKPNASRKKGGGSCLPAKTRRGCNCIIISRTRRDDIQCPDRQSGR